MTELIVAEDEEWMRQWDMHPRLVDRSGETWVREVHAVTSAGAEIRVSWDEVAQSVDLRVRVQGGAGLSVNLVREGVTLLTTDRRESTPTLIVEYDGVANFGRLVLRSEPAITVDDSYLQ